MSDGRIPLTTVESLAVPLRADADPTSETVAFYWTTGADTDQPAPGEFIAGTWVAGSYDTRTKWAEARTHTAGATGGPRTPAQELTAGDWRLWARITTATEAPVIDCGVWTFY